VAPNVIRVLPMNDYTVQVHFSDGKVVCYDVKPLLSQGVFKQLQNIHIFKNTCTILNNTLAWDISGKQDKSNCIDIDPETLYKLPAIKDKAAG